MQAGQNFIGTSRQNCMIMCSNLVETLHMKLNFDNQHMLEIQKQSCAYSQKYIFGTSFVSFVPYIFQAIKANVLMIGKNAWSVALVTFFIFVKFNPVCFGQFAPQYPLYK